MNDPMEKIIRETLRDRPAPQPGPDFVAAVMERLEKKKARPRSVWDELAVLAAYWAGVLAVSTLVLAGTATPGISNVWLVILTPVIFTAPLAYGLSRRLVSSAV